MRQILMLDREDYGADQFHLRSLFPLAFLTELLEWCVLVYCTSEILGTSSELGRRFPWISNYSLLPALIVVSISLSMLVARPDELELCRQLLVPPSFDPVGDLAPNCLQSIRSIAIVRLLLLMVILLLNVWRWKFRVPLLFWLFSRDMKLSVGWCFLVHFVY